MSIENSLMLPTKDSDGIMLSHYLVAHAHPELAREIYTYAGDADIAPLYIDTSLASLIEQSPYVVSIFQNDPLFEVYQENAQQHHVHNDKSTKSEKAPWSGIIVSVRATVSFEMVLAYLRHRVLIQFSGKRKGVFHFQNPKIARYFFGEAQLKDTQEWMGPLLYLHWYEQWHCGAGDPQGQWRQVENPEPTYELFSQAQSSGGDEASYESMPLWQLRESQQQALELQFDDKNIVRFFNETMQSVPSLDERNVYRTYIKQAEQLSFYQTQELDAYFTLRRQYPRINQARLSDPSLETLTVNEKLQFLDSMLRKDALYVS
ncbi:DUF4123 domain-containing protein [Shewanella surugensis]|uniref:DUF4123 domain-containing protein n=1 Tax=Shewanella surugensis TaxID=212020 RepID=A0ABT0L5L0_9GAMM|nr:DUF4123 domain-containing protein [Shewanella surugensis]MCL1122973.1 DUF4123 domain-containing protein [Shewanella surugensis]